MARIKGKDLYLKDDDQIYFGDSNEAAIWYDEGTELRLSHTISGTTAIEDYHLVQKGYVDDIIATISGGGTLPHDHEVTDISTESPTTSGESGDIFYDPDFGMPFYYDGARGKWLSSDRVMLVFSKDAGATNTYLKIGTVAHADAGYYVHDNSTIVGIYCKSVSAPDSKSFEIRDAADHSYIHGFSYTGDGTDKYVTSDANVDVVSGTELQVFVLAGGAPAQDTLCQITLAKRYDV